MNSNLVPAFYIVGVLLVLFSGGIGQALVTHPGPPPLPGYMYSAPTYQWNIQEANQAAEVVRWIGAMLFATGLVERMILCLRAPVPAHPSDQIGD